MSTISINPTKVICEDIPEVKDKTESGIFIPSTIKSVSMRGKIIFKGDGLKDMPLVHKVGDIALYNPRAGQKFEWNDKEYRILDAGEIFLSGV